MDAMSKRDVVLQKLDERRDKFENDNMASMVEKKKLSKLIKVMEQKYETTHRNLVEMQGKYGITKRIKCEIRTNCYYKKILMGQMMGQKRNSLN